MMPPSGIDIWNPNAILLERDMTTGEVEEHQNPDERDGMMPAEWVKLRDRGHRDWGPLLQHGVLASVELFWTKPADAEPPRHSPTLAGRLIIISAGCNARFTEERFQAALAAKPRGQQTPRHPVRLDQGSNGLRDHPNRDREGLHDAPSRTGDAHAGAYARPGNKAPQRVAADVPRPAWQPKTAAGPTNV